MHRFYDSCYELSHDTLPQPATIALARPLELRGAIGTICTATFSAFYHVHSNRASTADITHVVFLGRQQQAYASRSLEYSKGLVSSLTAAQQHPAEYRTHAR